MSDVDTSSFLWSSLLEYAHLVVQYAVGKAVIHCTLGSLAEEDIAAIW